MLGIINQLSQFKYRRGIRYDLADFLEAAQHLGNPHLQLPPVIHIAGTNGKGSTTAYIAQGLRSLGYCVGTYTSPHMVSYCERIADNDGPIAAHLFCELADTVIRGLPLDFAERITEFEILTLMGFLYFQQTQPDFVVVETGLGGRLDATNIVRPLVSVVTPIGLDHQEILGETVTAIAAEKAGIIKAGVPVFSAIQESEAAAVLTRTAERIKTSLTVIPPWETLPETYAMQGLYQRQNAALAYQVVHHVSGKTVSKDALAPAFVWGRFTQIMHNGQRFIIDGAHNPHGVRALKETLLLLGLRDLILWTGILKSRSLTDMIDPWVSMPQISDIWYTAFSDQAYDVETVVAQYPEVIPVAGENFSFQPTPKTIVVTGSLAFLAFWRERGFRGKM